MWPIERIESESVPRGEVPRVSLDTAERQKYRGRIAAICVSVAGRTVSFQITILKVLAGQPEGHASLVDLKHYVAVLTSSGADWSQRMKRISKRAPGLDIFSTGYVLRHPSGWQITDAGREFLRSIEAPVTDELVPESAASQSPVVSAQFDLPPNVIRLAAYKARRRPRRAA